MTSEKLAEFRAKGMLLDPKFDRLAKIGDKRKEVEKLKKKKSSIENIKKHNSDDNIKREIYLTFDDGLEQGTEEILELLKEKKIKATFFLIGKRIESFYKRDKTLCLKLLKDIYENHTIGNHSYSHANESYNSFYRDGGVVIKVTNGTKIRRTVVNDFVKSRNTILYYLALALGKANPLTSGYSDYQLKSKNQKKVLARFPGTNTWYIKDRIIDIKYTNRLNNIELPKQDTKEEAEAMGKTYNIFGWDCEWKMANPRSNDLIKNSIKDKIDKKTIRYDNLEDTDPFFDLYSKEYINYDKPVQSVEEIKDEILDLVYDSPFQLNDDKGMTKGKVILLMHDLQFRKGKLNSKKEVDFNDKSELNKLGELIDYFKLIKAEFKTLDNY
jgi:hypothetical protein